MASLIDPLIPAAGEPAVKSEMRANFSAAKSEIEALQASALPTGGTAGQRLIKTSGNDYAVAWSDPAATSTANTFRVVDYGAFGDGVVLRAINDITISETVAPSNGDTLTLNGVVLTWQTSPSAAADIEIPAGTWDRNHSIQAVGNMLTTIAAVDEDAINKELRFYAGETKVWVERGLATGQQGTAAITSSNPTAVAVDGWTLGATVTAGSTTLTMPGGSFTANDVGKLLAVQRAGPLGNTDGVGMTHWTTIASYTSATEIEMTDAAVTSAAECDVIYGTVDDAAIDAAIDALENSGRGGVVEFDQGKTYLVYQIKLARKVPVIVEGRNAVIMQAPGVLALSGPNKPILDCAPSWFLNHASIQANLYPQVIIRDVIIDGASWFQNNEEYADPLIRNRYVGRFNYEQNHAIRCSGTDEDGNDRLIGTWQPVTVIGVTCRNICGDGIHVARNVALGAHSIRGLNVFRGTLVVSSQCCSIYMSDLYCDDDDRIGEYMEDSTYNTGGQSGIYFETEDNLRNGVWIPQGFPYHHGVVIDGAYLRQGRCNIATLGNSSAEVVPPDTTFSITLRNFVIPQENNVATHAIFVCSGPGSINIYDSVFHGGRADYGSRTVFDGSNISAFNCRFIASDNMKWSIGAPSYVAALKLIGPAEVNYTERMRRLVNCTFTVDNTVAAGVPAYGVYLNAENMTSSNHLPANTSWVQGYFDQCYWMQYRNRDAATAGYPAEYRLLDYAIYASAGCNVVVTDCRGFVDKGFRWSAISNGGDSFLQLGSGFKLQAKTAMFDGSAQGTTLCRAYIDADGVRIDDAYWGITGGSTVLHRLSGDMVLEVENNPTTAGPISVVDQWITTRGPLLLHGRLAPGRGLVANSITFTETQIAPNLSYSDDAAGNLIDDADGVTVVGSIDYARGWFEIDPPSNRVNVAVRWRVSYQHDNGRPGIAGMRARLKSDPTTQWKCTVTSKTAATWVAI